MDRVEITPLPGADRRFDVRCTTCGGATVLEGDEPALDQLLVFRMRHEECAPPA